jgi:hypothetical protein
LDDFLKLFEGPHAVKVLLLLNGGRTPVATKDIMNALGIKNWATIAKTLDSLKEARLIALEEKSIGRYKTKTKFWSVEPGVGTKVADLLQEASRLAQEARVTPEKPSKRVDGRPAVIDIESVEEKLESAEEKLVTVMHYVVNKAVGA